MKAARHPLTQLGAEDMPGCLIAIDLCIDIMNTSGIAFASQALIRMRDAKSLVQGLVELAEERLAESVAREIVEAPQDEARQDRAARRVAAHLTRTTPRPPRQRGVAPTVWTDARLALLDAECGVADADHFLARVNALPGPRYANTNAMRTKFNARLRAGLVKRAPDAARRQAVVAKSSTIPEEDKPEARTMILAGGGAPDLVEEFGWDAEEAQAFAEAVRAEAKVAA